MNCVDRSCIWYCCFRLIQYNLTDLTLTDTPKSSSRDPTNKLQTFWKCQVPTTVYFPPSYICEMYYFYFFLFYLIATNAGNLKIIESGKKKKLHWGFLLRLDLFVRNSSLMPPPVLCCVLYLPLCQVCLFSRCHSSLQVVLGRPCFFFPEGIILLQYLKFDPGPF